MLQRGSNACEIWSKTDDRAKLEFLLFSLDLVKTPSQRAQYEEMLVATGDSSLLDELLDYEILDANEARAQKLQLLRLRKPKPDAHYDFLDRKNRPPLINGYLVQFCKYLEYRLKNLNSLCVMCGRRTIEATQKASFKVEFIVESITKDDEIF